MEIFGSTDECCSTVYVSKIAKHLKKCPAVLLKAKQERKVYFKKGINDFHHPNLDIESLHTFSQEKLIHRLLKWTRLQEKEVSSDHIVVGNQEKHELQLQALVKQIITRTTGDNIIGVEIGAGKGTLSAALHGEKIHWSHLLVDIQKNFRNKAENKLSIDSSESTFERIHIDIADLHLGIALDSIFNSDTECVMYAKHLCGLALDKTLHCIVHTMDQNRVNSIVMATCCHHRCTFDQYCSKFVLFI